MADYVNVTELTNPNHPRESASSPTHPSHAVTIPVTTPPVFYNTSPATPSHASTTSVQEEKNGSICQNCGISGPAPKDQPRCYPSTASDMRLHHFVHPKAKHSHEKDKTKEKKEKEDGDKRPYRLFWKVAYVLIVLALYGISIVYIVIPVQKYLTQDPTTAVTITTATKDKPVTFPALQVCNFNWNTKLKSIHVYYEDLTAKILTEITNTNVKTVKMDDYGYDFECYEVNNKAEDGIQIGSKRQGVIIIAEVEAPQDTEVYLNDDCTPGLCDPDLPPNANITDIAPDQDALGISLAFFQATGKPRDNFDGSMYLTSGTYSQVFITLARTYKYETPDVGIEAYSASSSSIRFIPGAYALNFTANQNFKMDEVVYVSINYGDLAYTEIRESKAYEAFNAFGDATAILGFFTGFGVLGGYTFFDLLKEYSDKPFWANIWHK